MITLSPFSVTVDGLFMTLILLTLSAMLLLNAFLGSCAISGHAG